LDCGQGFSQKDSSLSAQLWKVSNDPANHRPIPVTNLHSIFERVTLLATINGINAAITLWNRKVIARRAFTNDIYGVAIKASGVP
jgi:hypothetical protein